MLLNNTFIKMAWMLLDTLLLWTFSGSFRATVNLSAF